jgi:hypothetical protein
MSATLTDPPVTSFEPLPVPPTSWLKDRLAAIVRERDAVRALLRVSLKHDRLQELRARMEAATDAR